MLRAVPIGHLETGLVLPFSEKLLNLSLGLERKRRINLARVYQEWDLRGLEQRVEVLGNLETRRVRNNRDVDYIGLRALDDRRSCSTVCHRL